jgi:WD40 repeat protein
MRIVWMLLAVAVAPAVMAGEAEPQLKLLEALEGHPGPYGTIAFSPDGKLLAAGDHVQKVGEPIDGSVKLWDVDKRQVIATLRGDDKGLGDDNSFSVAFSPDGKTLAVGGADLTLWDVNTGKKKSSFKEHGAPAFSPDGKTLAALRAANTVTLLDVETGKEKGSLKNEKDPRGDELGTMISLAFSPDGKLIATGSGKSVPNGSAGGEVTLWNVDTGKPKATLKCMVHVRSVAFSPDSKTLASADMLGNVLLWDVQSGRQAATLQKFNPRGRDEGRNGAFSVAFSPNGKTLAAGTLRGIKLWDVKSGESVGPSMGPSAATVWAVAFRRDGKTLASAGSRRIIGQKDSVHGDETLRLWEWIPAEKADK